MMWLKNALNINLSYFSKNGHITPCFNAKNKKWIAFTGIVNRGGTFKLDSNLLYGIL